MIITLPKDIEEIKISRKVGVKAFRLSRSNGRLTVPREIIGIFKNLGVDMFVSKSEKSLYLTFVPKNQSQFKISQANGQISCRKLFEWLSYAEVPVFDDYLYGEYQIDTKNKIVKLNLVRK